MNNSSPLIPQGTLLEQQNKGRARFKVAVLCVLGFHVLLFGGVLMLGCKRDAGTTADNTQSGTGSGSTDTSITAATMPNNNDPNAAAPNNTTTSSNPGTTTTASTPSTTIAPSSAPMTAPVSTPVPPTAPTTAAIPTGTAQDYTLAKGDTYSSIGKKFGVSVKALEAANPTMPPTKLMPGKKIQIPAPTTVAAASVSTAAPGMAADASDVYVVKSGDSLTAIAHGHSTSVKALMAANNLSTTRIRVGDKLHLPAPKAATPPAVPAADATATPTSATSTVPPLTAPAATLR